MGVGVVIFKGEEVLLIKRGKEPRKGEWSLPGGAQELGETTADTAHREVMEETGLTIRLGEIVDVVNVVQENAVGRIAYHYVIIDYVAEFLEGTAVAMDDAVDVKWVGYTKILTLGLWSETTRIIQKAWKIRGLT